MNHRLTNNRRIRGASTLEVVVAFSLLSAILAVTTPLVVQHSRLLKSHRDYQWALEELSNQLDGLTALPASELPKAIEQVAPSEWAAARLPQAELKADLTPAEPGQRLALSLTWEGLHGRGAPVRMAAWVYPQQEGAP